MNEVYELKQATFIKKKNKPKRAIKSKREC
jgi:hypothetical protein